MSEREQIALVDQLRALPAETEWLEFKRNRHEPQELGEYLSALSNAACLASQPRGYQKRRNVHNLLQELRRAGKLDNRGSRGQPAWYPLEGARR